MVKVKKRLVATLFDRNYAAKGYAMLRSLEPYTLGRSIDLRVLALDDWTWKALSEKPPACLLATRLGDLEAAMELSEIRKRRTWREYCWTLASQFSAYLLRLPGYDQVTYLDADLFFFSDPQDAFRMIGEASVAAAPHRFDEAHAGYAKNGRYNVGWVTFRKDPEGVAAAEDWARSVRDHCSEQNGPHGLGDQGYLDGFPGKYARFREIGHPGVDLGPWSLQDVAIGPGPVVDELPVVCYHFHEFGEEREGIRLTFYPLSEAEVTHLYRPYVLEYEKMKNFLDIPAAQGGPRLLWTPR